MKQARKKLFGIVTAVVLFLSIFGHNSMSTKAEDVSVIIALSSSSVSKGDGVTVTISVNGGSLSAYTMYVSYSSGLLQFNSGSGAVVAGGGGTVTVSGTGAGTVTLSFTAIAEGQASVSTSSTEFYDINGTQLSVAHAGVVIQVGGNATTEQPQSTTESTTQSTTETTEDGKSDNSNLVRLQLTNGTLEPEFVYYQTSYFVQLDKAATSLGVVAEAEDSKAKVQINGADELKPGENKVTIVVTAENGSTKTYSIRVAVGELLENVQVEIEGKKYAFANDIEEDGVPEGYTETTVSYGDWSIVAYESPNKQLILVGLKEIVSENEASQDADQTSDQENDEQTDEITWFIYDEEGQTFVPYEEVLAANNRYVIMQLPEGVELPDGYAEAELTINDKAVLAYRSEYATDADMYLVYAMNIYGDAGFYLYDRAEQTFMRYAPDDIPQPEVATVADATVIDAKPVTSNKTDDTFSRMILIISLIGCICLLVIFVVLSFVQISKKRQLREELDLAESMVEQLVASNNANKVGVLKPVEDVQDNTQPKIEAPAEVQETVQKQDSAETQETVQEQAPTETQETIQEQPPAEVQETVQEQAPAEVQETVQKEAQTEKKESRKERRAREKAEKKLRKAAKKEALKEDYSEEIINTMAGVTKDDLSDEQIDHIPEIVLEDYEEKSKEIQEKINGDYDADQDSAFAQTDNTDN